MRILSSQSIIRSVIVTAGIVLFSANGLAASAIGQVLFTVIRPLVLQQISALNFSPAEAGSAESTVLPSDANSAKFSVVGEPNTAYQIVLPSEITATNGGTQSNQMITISNFKSFPQSVGHLSDSGEQTIAIGATRSALLPNQEVGSYAGEFVVQIVY